MKTNKSLEELYSDLGKVDYQIELYKSALEQLQNQRVTLLKSINSNNEQHTLPEDE